MPAAAGCTTRIVLSAANATISRGDPARRFPEAAERADAGPSLAQARPRRANAETSLPLARPGRAGARPGRSEAVRSRSDATPGCRDLVPRRCDATPTRARTRSRCDAALPRRVGLVASPVPDPSGSRRAGNRNGRIRCGRVVFSPSGHLPRAGERDSGAGPGMSRERRLDPTNRPAGETCPERRCATLSPAAEPGQTMHETCRRVHGHRFAARASYTAYAMRASRPGVAQDANRPRDDNEGVYSGLMTAGA